MKTVHIFDVVLPNNGWEGLYESEVLDILKNHHESYEVRTYTLNNARRMTIGVLTIDSVYESILQSIRTNLGIEIAEVPE
jgi:hypothetical protein